MRLLTGKARSGKTAAIIGEIRRAVAEKRGKLLLIVPEQYSHEAERELCSACGDSLSLYAEVMSFSGLARWAAARFGGSARVHMDPGGKLLCMALAVQELRPLLKIYAPAAEQTDLQLQLLRETETLRNAAIESDRLRALAAELGDELGEKVREIAWIMDAYDSVVARAGAVTEEPLALLAKQIEQYGLPGIEEIYVDGFLDFTGLEKAVLKAILKRDVRMTVCLTAAEENTGEEHFLLSRIAAAQLLETAKELGRKTEIRTVRRTEENALDCFTDHMFDFAAEKRSLSDGEICVWRAAHPMAECEAAAAEILRAVREDGCRWRDFAVAIRGFEDRRQMLESCFRRYGIPLFTTRKGKLTDRPLPFFIDSAYEIILGNWEAEDVTAYLRCGLSGLEEEECDELCAYLGKWRLKERDWLREEAWEQHPDGYGQPRTEETELKLQRINAARKKVANPLMLLRSRSRKAETAAEQTEALTAFLRECRMECRLQERAQSLQREGQLELAGEYQQLWEICRNALLQITSILENRPLNVQQFRQLFSSMLSQIDIGLIPVALDRVSAGDFDRMRRRNIRRLIVLGCSDDRLPPVRSEVGVFSSDERDRLAEHSVLIGGGEAELWREYALIYQTLSLPREQLILSCPDTDGKGEKLLPAFVYTQALRFFELQPETVKPGEARLSAKEPAFRLAAAALKSGNVPENLAAASWFHKTEPGKLEELWEKTNRSRDRLSAGTVEALYGKNLFVSPSRLEQFTDCRFGYYCRFGLKAKSEEEADFHPPEIGSFTHEILEKTAKEVKRRGGFRVVTDEELRELCNVYIREYVETELQGFREKSARFRYLFRRICEDVCRIVLDTAEELRRSDFEPLSFELDVSGLGGEIPLQDGKIRINGIADRVDGWIRGNRLELRVVDYKTGRKKFSLSDVWYGRSLQMLLYLYTVCDASEQLYGMCGEPAGILYLPARENLLSFDSAPDLKEAEKEKRTERRRSGLVLSDRELAEAWEHGDDKVFIPIRTKSADPLVSLEQMGKLRRHVEKRLKEMGEELKKGSIEANPSVAGEKNACELCPYHSICHFEEGLNGESSRIFRNLKDEEVWEKLDQETEAKKMSPTAEDGAEG